MNIPSHTRRFFLALPAPSTSDILLQKIRSVNISHEKIKWMRPHNLHLTVYFIGNIPSEKTEELIARVSSLLCIQQRFSLAFESLVLAPAHKPRMIWAKYARHDQFTQLVNQIHHALQPMVRSSNRFYYPDPVPHITLARFHSFKAYRDIRLPRDILFPSVEYKGCELWESIPVGGQVDYRSIYTFTIG